MKKKIISCLSFMAAFVFLLQSCIHDEFTNSENPSQNASSVAAKYTSKSPWKEDEVYINKVQQVFLKYANLPRVNETYGELHWEYAMSFGQFGERYALVPIVKDNKVVLLMEAVRKENKVYFYEKTDVNLLQFFNYLLYSPTSDYKETINGADTAGKAKYVCTTRTLIVGCPPEIPDCTPITSSQTVCEWQADSGSGTPPKGFDPLGDPFSGGGGGGGYDYPDPPQDDPCNKLNAQTNNATFKDNITDLEGKTGDNYESGFRISNTGQNQLLQNVPGTQQVDMKVFSNTVTLMHSHYDGLYPIFSPGDIIFFNRWINWAIQWNNVPTNTPKIPINELVFTIVTSWGNYSFTFDGSSSTPFSNYTEQEIKDMNDLYMKLLDEAKSIGNVSGNVSYDMTKLEQQFLKFMDKKLNIPSAKLFRNTSTGNTQLSLVNGKLTETKCP